RDWSQSYRDFPELSGSEMEETFFARLNEVALSNIRERPEVFVNSLFQAGKGFIQWPFTIGRLGGFNGPLTVLALVGLIVCVAGYRRAVHALLLAFALGELVSAPFIIDSA